jgi:hypothetical protein
LLSPLNQSIHTLFSGKKEDIKSGKNKNRKLSNDSFGKGYL